MNTKKTQTDFEFGVVEPLIALLNVIPMFISEIFIVYSLIYFAYTPVPIA